MAGDRKIQRYVDARRDLAKLRRQLQDYPELSGSRPFLEDLHLATVATATALGALNGGQLGRALRLLADGETRPKG